MFFQSRKDLLFFILIWGTIIALVLLTVLNLESTGNQLIPSDSIVGYIFTFLLTIPLIWIWFGTGYIIENDKLFFKFGPIKSHINIKEIKTIRKVKSPFTAPALAINRIRITYGNLTEVVDVSPKQEKEFIEVLLKKNPEIIKEENI